MLLIYELDFMPLHTCFQLSVTREATYVVVSAQLPRGRPVNRWGWACKPFPCRQPCQHLPRQRPRLCWKLPAYHQQINQMLACIQVFCKAPLNVPHTHQFSKAQKSHKISNRREPLLPEVGCWWEGKKIPALLHWWVRRMGSLPLSF